MRNEKPSRPKPDAKALDERIAEEVIAIMARAAWNAHYAERPDLWLDFKQV